MPPQIAALVCILLIFWFFWIDRKNNEGVSQTIWIPLIWMLLAGSRYISQWLNLGGPTTLVEASTEGSPFDAAFFFLLIMAGVFILSRRKIDWGRLLIKNRWIWLYFLYCGISILWSDYPFVGFKRWLKELGNPIMVLVILTEEHPYQAIGTILRRFAFLLLPLSVLFIRYYPNLGRAYHMGMPMVVGVASQKNGLGMICLLSGIYFSWELLINSRYQKESKQRLHYSIYLILLPMIAWLLYMANSSTSLACTIAAIGIFTVGRQPAIVSNPRRILQLGIACVALFGILQITFNVKDTVISMLGRNPDLTTRVPMWLNLLSMVENPIIGTGFMSFWSGERLEIIFEKIGTQGVQAHNGYLEQYLNLGYIGVVLIGIIMLSGLLKVRRHLNLDYPSAMLRLCFIVIAALYNYTEASFYGINNMWLLLLFGLIEISDQQGSIRTDLSEMNIKKADEVVS